MQKVSTEDLLKKIPDDFKTIVSSGIIYDSSSSEEAEVYFIDFEEGYYLKRSKKGSLAQEAFMHDFFYTKNLSSSVKAYRTNECDWLLTKALEGHQACSALHLSNPKLLAERIGESLRHLHETHCADVTLSNTTERLLIAAENNYHLHASYLNRYPELCHVQTEKDAYQILSDGKDLLRHDVLVHGDYCLPNVILTDLYTCSGFVDLGFSGFGDRHIDLYWGAWSLKFNLNTNAYSERFFDAYGRDLIDQDVLRIIGALGIFT